MFELLLSMWAVLGNFQFCLLQEICSCNFSQKEKTKDHSFSNNLVTIKIPRVFMHTESKSGLYFGLFLEVLVMTLELMTGFTGFMKQFFFQNPRGIIVNNQYTMLKLFSTQRGGGSLEPPLKFF